MLYGFLLAINQYFKCCNMATFLTSVYILNHSKHPEANTNLDLSQYKHNLTEVAGAEILIVCKAVTQSEI